MAATTTTQIPAEVNALYVRTLLERATSLLVHNRFAQVKDLPRNSGTATIKFRRYANLTAATTPLTEGTTPAGKQLSQTVVTADVSQYGDYVTVTDVLDFQSQDAVLLEAAEILGDQAGDTIDLLARDIITAGTNVLYVGQVARAAITATDLIDTASIKKMVRTLEKENAKVITRQIDPSTGYGTEAAAKAFVGIVSPETGYDLDSLDDFVPVEKYSSKMDVMDGEIGKNKKVRFIQTTNAKVFTGAGAGGIDVHATLILGANAYGTSRVSGEAMQNIIKPLGAGDDPLNQRATSGWKATFTAVILNNAFMGRLEHAVSD